PAFPWARLSFNSSLICCNRPPICWACLMSEPILARFPSPLNTVLPFAVRKLSRLRIFNPHHASIKQLARPANQGMLGDVGHPLSIRNRLRNCLLRGLFVFQSHKFHAYRPPSHFRQGSFQLGAV